MDARTFEPADHIDPDYGAVLRRVAGQSDGVLAYDVEMDLGGIRLRRPVPCRL